MQPEQIFVIAIKAIWANKVRSFLTMLGVIIGVGSVVMLTSIGNGLQIYITGQFAALGTNIIYVIPGDPFGEDGMFAGSEQAMLDAFAPTLKRHQLEKILRDNRDIIADGVPGNVGVASAQYESETKRATLYGVTPNYASLMSHPAEAGTWFSEVDEDRARKVAMLGSRIATELFGNVDPVGREIRLDGIRFTVLGVLESKGGGAANFDQYIYLPFRTVEEVFNVEAIDNFMLEVFDQADIPEALERIETYLLTEIEEGKFTVIDQEEMLKTIEEILAMLTIGLGGIAAISLLVGGIGIMNIMLVSVTERTREIGLRKALGATPNIIMVQFLIEAALLSVIGGMIGLLLAYLGSLAIQPFFPAQVTNEAVVLAFGVSTMVGLIFGAAPARRAAKLSPIEALRYE